MSYDLAVSLAASGSAGGLACAALNPLDTLKVRFQVSPTVGAESLMQFGANIAKSEGFVRGLWMPGVLPNFLGIAISSMGRVGIYPYVRDAGLAAVGAGQNNATAMFSAGLVSGAIGYIACAPIYQVKTLAQAEAGALDARGVLTTGARAGAVAKHHGQTLLASLRVLSAEGALYRGAGTLVLRGAILSAGQQVGYDGLKTVSKRRAARGELALPDGPVLHAAASVSGALGATLCSTPADVVMTRYQSASQMGITYASSLECAAHILRTEGPLGFYRGFVPFFVRLCPVFIISLPLTEQLRRLFGLDYL